MRLIDADALYEELRYMPYDNILEGTIGHERPLRAIVNAPTVEMPGWISVQDRLPEKNVPVLVWADDGFAYVDRRETECTWGIASVYEANVTHWMPLPNPPKEVQDGQTD